MIYFYITGIVISLLLLIIGSLILWKRSKKEKSEEKIEGHKLYHSFIELFPYTLFLAAIVIAIALIISFVNI